MVKKVDWSAVVQILANLGVIASIVFLAFQVRQNNELLGIQTRANALNRMVGTTDLVLENPVVLELLRKDESALSPTERDTLIVLGLRNLSNFEVAYQDARRGLMDEDALQRTVAAVWNRPVLNFGVRIAWPTFKERGTSDFVTWMEANVVDDD